MKRQFVVKASTEAVARKQENVQAASTADMLDAFQDKLEEFGVESSTDVKASEEDDRKVEIYDSDYDEKYEDVYGSFGDPGQVYSLAVIKMYWNNNRYSDPVLESYSSFDEWWKDTKNYFIAQ